MAPSSRDRISVDLHGLRAALFAQARARGVTPSDLVRGVLAETLADVDSASNKSSTTDSGVVPRGRVRLSLRLTAEQARAITSAAKTAGLPIGEFVSGLVAGVPVLTGGADRTAHLSALIASSAELSTLRRNIRHLTSLLRQGEVQAAREYRAMFDTLGDDIRGHLKLASSVLSNLRSRSRKADASRHPSS